ncbi:MAG: phosphoribosylformylglycinamidine synthase subunit PurL [Proteobacteria bacterium]|nr:MAG: phosphoribosylformylglycinamidine synthase subunit PurL [Pseudomonadota bacterium]|tara:strand:- start:1104 stop:3329 length:2226 start_codon:yes stop_codon:yes gene_type:complete
MPQEPSPQQIAEQKIYREMGLIPDEYNRIVELLGRQPNYRETGIFAVMWSEHCSYKNSKPLLKLFPTEGPQVLQGPGEGAGIVDIGDGWAVVFKVESHNHPTAVEPYQGAATGVGGILRDIFSMGARPIALMNSLRFGTLDKAHNRYLLSHAVSGIAAYGNCIGVPTVGGEVFLETCYDENPLVNVFCLGIVKHDQIQHGKASGLGNPVLYLGNATGRDGIHGATFASEELSEGSASKRPAVQVGDPFAGKRLLEACVEIYQTGAVVSVQDMGAAGLTCSSTEMGFKGQTGIDLNLDKVPKRAESMTAYEIMLSESQERMLFVIEKGRESEVQKICDKWELPNAIVGEVTNSQHLSLFQDGQQVANLPLDACCELTPVYQREAHPPEKETLPKSSSPEKEPENYLEVLKQLLVHPNISDKSWVYQQYDSMVGTRTAQGPGGDAAVIILEECQKALAISMDGNSRYVVLDPYWGGLITVAEAARNVVCAGARPLALTDGLNYGSPEKPEIFWQMQESVRGMAEACEFLSLPVTGGNVSLYNESHGEAIYPTPIIGMVGLIENLNHITPSNFQSLGDQIWLLGETFAELGGSCYQEISSGGIFGDAPKLELDREKRLQEAVLVAIESGLVSSAHDLSLGGLAVGLVKASTESFSASVSFESALRADEFLFSESPSRILLSIPNQFSALLQSIMAKHKIPAMMMGKVVSDQFRISFNDELLIQDQIQSLKACWRNGFRNYFTKT